MRTRSSWQTTTLVLLTALALTGLSAGVMAAAPAKPVRTELLVGFEGPVDAQLLSQNGAAVKRVLGATGIALVEAPAGEGFARALAAQPGIRFAVPNQPLALDSVQPAASTWDASTWDASTWDASTWDASTWDASTWDASTWDASTWDASTWDASTWDASTWDASTWDASTWDASTWDMANPDPGFGEQWGIGATQTHVAWNTLRSSSATICLLDTGVEASHPDLQGAILAGYNAMNGGTDVTDENGHGTHIAGIIAARGGNGIGIAGVVQAQLLIVKVMGANGGTEADLIAGIDHCRTQGAKIASMSIHVTQPDAALASAVQAAQDAGMLLVASAGNQGASSIQYPAAYPGVISVGAVQADGAVAAFSNTGSGLDLVAPGVHIGSAALGGGYMMGSGTSQAVPFVSGAAALAWQVQPTLTAAQLATMLTGTARDVGAAGYDTTSGHGVVDAAALVQAALAN